MATKDHRLLFESKQSAQSNFISKSDSQYSNLNLNQNHKCFGITPVQSKTISNKTNVDGRINKTSNKTSDQYSDNFSNKTFNNVSKNEFGKNLKSSKFSNLSENGTQKQLNHKLSTENSSTLSLHITAYENSIKAADSDAKNDAINEKSKPSNFGKIKNSVKHNFGNSSLSKAASFEIPRQQKEYERNEPEIMQFKASQKLLSPNNVGIGGIEMTENDAETEADNHATESAVLFQENDERKIEIESLMKDVETKIQNFVEFMEVYTLRKMLFNISGFKRFEDLADSIDNVIKWYESEVARYRSYNNIIMKGIDKLIEDSAIKNHEEQVKVMEEKLEEMKTAKLEMQAECDSMKQKEQSKNETIEKMEEKMNTADYELQTMKSNLDQKNDNIKHLKQQCEEASRLFHAKNVELNQRNAQLEAELQAKSIQINNEKAETSKVISELEKQLSDASLITNEKIKALENEIAELKKTDAARKSISEILAAPKVRNDNFVELKDVVVEGEINYDLLDGKVLVVNKLEHGYNCWEAFYTDGKEEEKMVKLKLNDSFKLHLNGSVWISPPRFSSNLDHLYPHLHSCELKELSLDGHISRYEQFLKLVGSKTIEKLSFEVVSVDDESGKDLPLEKMLTFFPNVKELEFFCRNTIACTHNCRLETASNLLKLPIFKNLQKFHLFTCPYGFDLELFGNFMKKHSKAEFRVSVVDNSKSRYRGILFQFSQEVVNKMHNDRKAILRSWPKNSPRPDIAFTIPVL